MNLTKKTFTKMQGLGNDFILINALSDQLPEDYCALALKICDRHFGIGADGLMVVLPSECADIRMRIINSDGSEPEMCGNGIRCFAKYVYEQGIVPKTTMTVETLAGIMVPELLMDEQGNVRWVKVDMGEPILSKALIPMLGEGTEAIRQPITIEGQSFTVTAVSMGNPHCVIFTDERTLQDELATWGALIERSAYFPKKTNVEFVHVLNRTEVIMGVWERGAGITMACGTGACAVAVASILTGQTERLITVHLDGGDLVIQWSAETNHVMMTGAATNIFTGELIPD